MLEQKAGAPLFYNIIHPGNCPELSQESLSRMLFPMGSFPVEFPLWWYIYMAYTCMCIYIHNMISS